MMKHEFEALIKKEITQDEYDLVETVYMYHPAISDTTGKKQVADFYKQGLIRDLLPRAQRLAENECLSNNALRNREKIVEKYAKRRAELEQARIDLESARQNELNDNDAYITELIHQHQELEK